MDHTPGPSGEQGTEEMPETAEEEPVLLRLRVRFQDDFLSHVINLRLQKTNYVFT